MDLSQQVADATQMFINADRDQRKEVVAQMRVADPNSFRPVGDQAKERIWIGLLIGLFILIQNSALIALAAAVVSGLFGPSVSSPTE